MIDIRAERPTDLAGIHEVHRRACGLLEADLVDRLRAHGAAMLSLVVTHNDQVIGHVFYSPANIGGVTGAALGPMGVMPEHQRQGVGSQLVETGNRLLAEGGCPFIVVLGHAAYYPRFGFRPASTRAITCRWNVPDDVFMVLVLDEGRMRGVSGEAQYRDEFYVP